MKPLLNGPGRNVNLSLAENFYTVPRIWIPHGPNCKHLCETQLAYNGNNFGPLQFIYRQVKLSVL
jgi:hypothetical protein